MYRECMGGPLDGDLVPDYGPGWIQMVRLAESLIAMPDEITPITPDTAVPVTVRYHGCGNGHYHYDPE